MFGRLLSFSINIWMRITGRSVDLARHPWLDGPIGENYIGETFYQEYAKDKGYMASTPPGSGLMHDFTVLGSGDHPHLRKKIQHFYEHTSLYKMEVWTKAYYPVKPFAKLLIRSISREINQLNIPLDSMDTSRGMTSEVICLSTPAGEKKMVCWLRKVNVTNRVVYSGFYSPVVINGKPFVRVVFPLPNGNVTVVLRPEFREDGSFRLISDRLGFGGAGYYRVQHSKPGFVKVRMIPLKEIIHVFEDEKGDLRTDHEFRFWGMKFLNLHYKLIPGEE